MSDTTTYDKIEAEKKREIMGEFHEIIGKSAHMHENGESFDAYVHLYEAAKEMSEKLNENTSVHFE